MNPVYREDATESIQNILANMENQKKDSSTSWIMDRKRELVEKMKEDTDNKEYPVMLNALLILLLFSCLYHIFFNEMYYLSIVMLVALGFYIFVLNKLKNAILKLQDGEKSIDQYMNDGYLIKDTRFTAVKFAFLIFFPIICFLLYRIVEDTTYSLPWWQYLTSAIIISSVAWLMFFSDDQVYLDNLEREIKGLSAIS
ncbi:MAG: hypothetical protein IPK25_05145 [Saprospiraceae bacterium]|nr:hypothetical protein [Saprospiraceae bacterium]